MPRKTANRKPNRRECPCSDTLRIFLMNAN